MRRPRPSHWNVEISPRAWDQLGVVSGEVFRRMKRALEGVADALQQGTLQPEAGHQTLTTARHRVRYRTDAELRAVVLEEVRPEADLDELTSTGRRRRKG